MVRIPDRGEQRMIYRLEKKFGKYAIKNLMKYVTVMYIVGWVISYVSPDFYKTWLMLDIDKVLKGQVWRFFTFVIQPVQQESQGAIDILFTIITLYLYYFVGTMLERLWGSFRFNVYFFSGVFFNILAVVCLYIGHYLYFGVGASYMITLEYINLSLFLAFATEFPDISVLLFFVVPIKVKYIGIALAVIEIVSILSVLSFNTYSGICMGVAFVVAMLNFILFFMNTKSYRKIPNPMRLKQRVEYAGAVKRGEREARVESTHQGKTVLTRHRCVVCGRTELDDPELEFRFCSKCEGNYEYCMDHLYTHVHVVREPKSDSEKEENE